MISTTVVPACPHCGSKALRKNGHTVRGAQRAKCPECARTLTLSPKGPRYDEKTKAQVLAAYQDCMPLDYRCRATRSDFWLADGAAFPERTHRFCGKQEGETNHAERWFGTVRAKLSRLVRRICSCSKSVECHLDAIHLFIVTHNLRIKQAASN